MFSYFFFIDFLFVVLIYSEQEPNADDAQRASEKTGPATWKNIYNNLNITLL